MGFGDVYLKLFCQKCKKPVSKKLMEERKEKKFFPVCKACEPAVTAQLIECRKAFAKFGKGFQRKR